MADVGSSKATSVAATLAALATGDAEPQEIVATLRRQKVDALDVIVELLDRVARASRPSPSVRRIDVQALRRPAASRATLPRKPVTRPAAQPFLLRGTLYDPQDITRLREDGAPDLHFVHTGADHLLAVDDIDVMESWWQTSYLSSLAYSSDVGSPDKVLGSETDPPGAVHPTDVGFPRGNGPGGVYPTHLVAAGSHTNFYEHPGKQGDYYRLFTGDEDDDLTNNHTGVFGLGDSWNDRISSVELVGTTTAVLWENVGFAGASFTATQYCPDLGWFNDLASGVKTWGGSFAWVPM
ncbi:MAG: Beta/Gamma crystallin [Nocardioidaceae bacterium]|nr:Beta/Gamma crystallin [Nocardioidaceae bacterium]